MTTTVRLGDREYAVGKLKLGAFRRNPDAFAKLAQRGDPTVDATSAMVRVVWEAIEAPKPAYEAFEAMVDALDFDTGMTQLADAVRVAMTGAGLVAPEGGGNGAGEAPPAAEYIPPPASRSSTVS